MLYKRIRKRVGDEIVLSARLFLLLNFNAPTQTKPPNLPQREDDEAKIVEEFWERMLRNHELFVNLLVLDEVIYVSRRKYDVPFSRTLESMDKAALPPRGGARAGIGGLFRG
ncbi:MAG: hypothetical protein J7J65_06470 [Candidatus Korarchaeota archaeon]|nr:hypothetical protein [Candidatus Korarchaeota archaeon]